MKSVEVMTMYNDAMSPSTRREWIEMLPMMHSMAIVLRVSLHTEGVD